MTQRLCLMPYPVEPPLSWVGGEFVDGIPICWSVEHQRFYYNPADICLYALRHYSAYCRTGHVQDRQVFEHQVNWLITHVTERKGGAACWLYEEEVSRYETGCPWISGMAQGLAISVLCRAYTLTGDNSFLNLARSSLECLELPVSEGGVRTNVTDEDFVFFEEYPSRYPILVLNGNIFTLFGLHDLSRVDYNDRAQILFRQAVRTLAHIIELYDFRGWSLYDLLIRHNTLNLSPPSYHLLHIELLEALARMVGSQDYDCAGELMRKAAAWKRGGTTKRTSFVLLMHLHRIKRVIRSRFTAGRAWQTLLPSFLLPGGSLAAAAEVRRPATEG